MFIEPTPQNELFAPEERKEILIYAGGYKYLAPRGESDIVGAELTPILITPSSVPRPRAESKPQFL
jgi:hypothetical protein